MKFITLYNRVAKIIVVKQLRRPPKKFEDVLEKCWKDLLIKITVNKYLENQNKSKEIK